MTDELWTVKQVMEYLKVSRSSVYRLVKEEKLHPVRIGPQTVRFERSEVQRLIEASKES